MRDDALSVIVCGSSAAGGIADYLVWIRQEVALDLRVLLTASAEQFVRPQAVAWYADEVYTSGDPSLNPTELARRSFALVVLPATANTLAAAALGLAATPAQTALLADDRPVLFFPNMNPTMWARPSTRRHVAALRAEGHTVVDPRERPVFELWRRENVPGIAMPSPPEAAEILIGWLEKRADEPAQEQADQAQEPEEQAG